MHITPTLMSEVYPLVHVRMYVQLFQTSANGLYSASLFLLGWFVDVHINAKAMLSNDINHIKTVELV